MKKASEIAKHPILWAIVSVWLSTFAIDAYRTIYPKEDDLKGRNVIVIPTTKFNEIIDKIGGRLDEQYKMIEYGKDICTQNTNSIILRCKVDEFQDYKIEENKRKIDKF